MFCIDIGRWVAIQASHNQAELDATRDKKVDPSTFARLARHFSERQICEIVCS